VASWTFEVDDVGAQRGDGLLGEVAAGDVVLLVLDGHSLQGHARVIASLGHGAVVGAAAVVSAAAEYGHVTEWVGPPGSPQLVVRRRMAIAAGTRSVGPGPVPAVYARERHIR
jgi:hypothetical protein